MMLTLFLSCFVSYAFLVIKISGFDFQADLTYNGSVPVVQLIGTVAPQHTKISYPYHVNPYMATWTQKLVDGVHYQDGSVIIQQKGVYLIYSQIIFLHVLRDPKPREERLALNTWHGIKRVPANTQQGPSMISVNRHTMSPFSLNSTSGSFAEYTSYIGAVSRLDIGDEIFVEILKSELIENDPLGNSFGLFKI